MDRISDFIFRVLLLCFVVGSFIIIIIILDPRLLFKLFALPYEWDYEY
jgi:hypothetical protein